MTNGHTAALKRALDSVRNAREILRSVGCGWKGAWATRTDLMAAEKRLRTAIDEESEG